MVFTDVLRTKKKIVNRVVAWPGIEPWFLACILLCATVDKLSHRIESVNRLLLFREKEKVWRRERREKQPPSFTLSICFH